MTGRALSLRLDGTPSPIMYVFGGWELLGVGVIYAYTRTTLEDGATTFNPGVCTSQASGFCEWKGPPWIPPPEGARITIGTAAPQR